MWTRRHLLQTVPTGLAAYALGACSDDTDKAQSDTASRGDTDAVTPSETETPASQETDTATASPSCVETPADIEGPFYRADAPERADIVRAGDTGRALTLSGRVLAGDGCTPPPNAVVDVWQADPMGVYDNATDAMDYRARVVCDADGRWSLRTFEPGRYLNGAQYRPAHLHVKVWVDGVERLTTQLYFPGDPYNDVDPWYDPQREVLATGDGTATYDLVV